MSRFALAVLLMFVGLITLSCEKEEKAATQEVPAVSDGTYRTEVITQPDFTEYNATEKVFSELIVQGDKATYIAYKNGKERSRKTGTWDAKLHSFMLSKDGQPTPDRHAVVDVTPDSFKMQVGRQGFDFKRVR